MMHPFRALLVRLVAAVLIGWIGLILFRAVFPEPVAGAISFGLAMLELASPLFSKQAGVGGSLRVLVQVAGALLLWPVLALVAENYVVADRAVAIALASGLACAVGLAASSHGSGKDRARVGAIIVSVSLPLYAMVVCASDPSPLAWVAAGASVTLAAVVAQAAGVWPAKIEREMTVAAGIAGAGTALSLLRWII